MAMTTILWWWWWHNSGNNSTTTTVKTFTMIMTTAQQHDDNTSFTDIQDGEGLFLWNEHWKWLLGWNLHLGTLLDSLPAVLCERITCCCPQNTGTDTLTLSLQHAQNLAQSAKHENCVIAQWLMHPAPSCTLLPWHRFHDQWGYWTKFHFYLSHGER